MNGLSSGLTVLRTLGPLATKKFTLDRLSGEVVKTPYGSAKYFSARAVRVEGIHDLSAKLTLLEGDPRSLIVRGDIAVGADVSRMRRLLYPEGEDQATLICRARRWVMLDFDNVPCPDGMDPARDPEPVVEYLISTLPPEFHDAACHWQFGSSQGFKPGRLSAHLWFWLDREVDDADLERWAKQHRSLGVDPAVFRAAQPHYTAAPTFDGVDDPLPRRSGLRRGSKDAVSIVLPAREPTEGRRSTGGLKPAVGFEGYLARIGTEDGFNEPIKSAIGAYVHEHGSDGTDIEALIVALRDAVREADPGGRDESEIARYASDDFLRAKVLWAISQERSNHLITGGWRDQLICSVDLYGNRKVKSVVANAILVLRNDDRWLGVLGFDDFAQRISVRGFPPYEEAGAAFQPREWRDEDDIQTAAWLQTNFALLVNPEIARQAALTIARDHPFHPVREYLEGLEWDGQPRLDSMLRTYFGVKETPFTVAVSALWSLSAVARVYRPGCKADHVLILEGPQGIGKSRSLSVLGGGWFTDEIDAIGSKDAATQLQGVWVVELAELDAMGRAEVSRIKAFMSKSFDRFRPPYGKHAVRFDRQCVFAGTVNHSEYLRDETGNRRFWPVKCSPITKDGKIDVEGLARDRDQVWAEAVVRFKRGERWWIESAEVVALAAAEQEARFATDAWEPAIARYVQTREWTTVAEVLDHLGVETPKQAQPEQNRVGRCLKRLGLKRRQKAIDGVRVWGYVPPAPVENAAPVSPDQSGAAEPVDSTASSPDAPVSLVVSGFMERTEEVGKEEKGVVEKQNVERVEQGWCTGESGASGAAPPAEYPCVGCGADLTEGVVLCDRCLAKRLDRRRQVEPSPNSCFTCGGTAFWTSPSGATTCRRCHPPVVEEAVS